MSGNGKAPVPFQAPAGTPIVGQAMTPLTVGVPMVMTLTCNCGPVADRATLTIHPLAALTRLLVEKGVLTEADALVVLAGASDTCPHCQKVYSVFFNPQNGTTQMTVTPPDPEQVPS